MPSYDRRASSRSRQRIVGLGLASTIALLAGAQARAACSLGANGAIKHVVYMQFDNTHFLRDNPNVPSDLEQMPHLLNFLSGKGMVLGNDHTQLISHTANGLLTSISGVYPDRLGAGAIANTFYYYNTRTLSPAHSNSTFVYWTDPLSGDNSASTGAPNPGADTSPVLVAETGLNAPAPWPAYTRAGCDFGAVGIADMDLENTGTDLATVFGRSSAEYAEGTSSSSTTRNQAVADFEGIALHCAKGSAVCAAANSVSKASPDLLPAEPGGYNGYPGIFGHKYVVPALMQVLGKPVNSVLTDLSGNEIGYLTVTANGTAPEATLQPGFPGFDGMFPAVTLSYAATMLEAGVPVVYGYFADAHDHHYATADGVNPQGSAFAYGPGEQGYTNQLKQYDTAFGEFFRRLKHDGIDETNTLFVILVEEGDKFAGATPVPANCDGMTVACTYPPIPTTAPRVSKGEIDVDFDQLLASQYNDTTGFSVHTDQAPAVWIDNQPAQNSTTTRQLERQLLSLQIPNAYQNDADVPLLVGMADQPALQMLHMVTADPLRTPTLVGFDQGDIYAGSGAVTTSLPGCSGRSVCTGPSYAWNHGGINAVVRQTWSGMVGPGVKHVGVDSTTWADHVDTRATMLALLHLTDDYAHDGRIIVENLDSNTLPAAIAGNLAGYERLAAAYKQLTAPFGAASTAALKIATAALRSGSATDDAEYAEYVAYANQYLALRGPLLAQIKTILNDAASGGSFPAAEAATDAAEADALTAGIVAVQHVVAP